MAALEPTKGKSLSTEEMRQQRLKVFDKADGNKSAEEGNEKYPIIVNWYSGKYPIVEELIDEQLISKGFKLLTKGGAGSANETYVYINPSTNKKRIVRSEFHGKFLYNIKTKKFIPSINGRYSLSNESTGTDLFFSATEENNSKGRFMKIIQQSYENWIVSNQLNLSPDLYFYGYTRSSEVDRNYIKLKQTIISEAYDTDLHDYYMKELSKPERLNPDGTLKSKLKVEDIQIRIKLTELLNTISKAPLHIICFDIKPKNCVLNINPLEVKLIDWDGDWCKKYNNLNTQDQNSNENSMSNLAGILSNMVMANQFYTHIEFNIFAPYFQYLKNRQNLEEKKAALKEIFSNQVGYNYVFFSDHYFRINDQVKDVNELFEILYQRCFSLIPSGDPFKASSRGGNKKKKKSNKQKRTRKSRKKFKKSKKLKKKFKKLKKLKKSKKKSKIF